MMNPETYFLEHKLSLAEAVARLFEDRRDVLAHKRPKEGGEYEPKIYRLRQISYRHMSRGAIMAWLEQEYMSFAKG